MTSTCLAFIFWYWKGYLAGISAILGGAISIVPEIVFILIYFKRTYARAARQVVTAFYLGEALKWLLTLVLFTVSFLWSKLNALPLFTTFIATQCAFWLVPLIYEHQRVGIHPTSPRASDDSDRLGDD